MGSGVREAEAFPSLKSGSESFLNLLCIMARSLFLFVI